VVGPAHASEARLSTIKDMKPIETIGKWQLRKGVDGFTDQVACVIVLDGNGNYQATNHDFYIHNEKKGRLLSYRLRFDDQPPSITKTASAVESAANAVDISWFDLGALQSAARLRLEILTKPQRRDPILYTLDLDVTGYAAIRASWSKHDCPR
jgi:hypothetical protein